MNEGLGRLHFWLTFIGAYCVFFPMHNLGVGGQMRRIYDPTQYVFLQPQQPVNVFITVAAFVLGTAQLIFLFNFFWSILAGRRATERNPWRATTLEWTAPTPPGHGNFGVELPTVHRWPFDFSMPGEKEDFVTQATPATIPAKH
jgi:cytochrome c oxidase subunit 1